MTDTVPTFVVGFDIASKCGWAVLDSDGERLSSGTWDCSVRRDEGAGMRSLRLQRHVGDLIRELEAQLAPGGWILWSYEVVKRHESTYAGQVHGELRGSVLSTLERGGHTRYAAIPVGTLKKAATGKGNAGKAAVMTACVNRWDYIAGDDNEADALWCAEVARLELQEGAA